MRQVPADVPVTIRWQRRQILLGGLLVVIPSCCAAASSGEYGGCWIDQGSTSEFVSDHSVGRVAIGEELISRSGVDGLEDALVKTLEMLSDMFGILPGFSYYNEKSEPNAKATSVDLLKNRADGTVLLGLKLLKDLLALPEHPDAAVVAVCAHEFAHILSYSNGSIHQLSPTSESPPFRAEQFADYMAGYFAGRRKLQNPNFTAAVFATTTGMYGGKTHGTADQRGNAVQEGFLCAYVRKAEPQAAAQRGLLFALGE